MPASVQAMAPPSPGRMPRPPSLSRGRQASYSTVVDRVRAGLPYAALEALAARFSIPHEAACRLLHIPPRTLARRKKDRRLRADEADRLLRLGRVAAPAEGAP